MVPRDPLRNIYITIGIPRESATIRALVADAEETGLSLATCASTRLTDWYRLATSGSPVPWQSSCSTSATQANGRDERSEREGRAAEAAIAWMMEEEE